MLRPTVRTVLVAGAFALLLSGVAWAAGMSVTSQRLTAAPLAPPAFHPTGVTVTIGANGGASPDNRDMITVTFNRALSAASVCALPPDITLTGFTVTLTDGGPVNDTLTVTGGPMTCPLPRIGTFDLGTGGYLTAGSATFTGSSIRVVTTTSPSLQITLGSRPSAKLNDVPTSTLVRFVPDAALTDLLGNPVRGTAASAVQF